MSSVGFEPTISAGERPKTHALDRAATGTGNLSSVTCKFAVNSLTFFSHKSPYCVSYITQRKVHSQRLTENSYTTKNKYTGLFEMIVRVLTTCHTQYT